MRWSDHTSDKTKKEEKSDLTKPHLKWGLQIYRFSWGTTCTLVLQEIGGDRKIHTDPPPGAFYKCKILLWAIHKQTWTRHWRFRQQFILIIRRIWILQDRPEVLAFAEECRRPCLSATPHWVWFTPVEQKLQVHCSEFHESLIRFNTHPEWHTPSLLFSTGPSKLFELQEHHEREREITTQWLESSSGHYVG